MIRVKKKVICMNLMRNPRDKFNLSYYLTTSDHNDGSSVLRVTLTYKLTTSSLEFKSLLDNQSIDIIYFILNTSAIFK